MFSRILCSLEYLGPTAQLQGNKRTLNNMWTNICNKYTLVQQECMTQNK